MPEAGIKIDGKSVIAPSRRQFAALGAVTALWGGSAVAAPTSVARKPLAVRSVRAESGTMLFRPETGEHPGLVMFETSGSSHSANAAVAQQLASQGWAVLLVGPHSIDDPARITRDTRGYVRWLVSQPGVAAITAKERDSMDGFTLRSFSAAQPSLSLASREERRAAAACNVLFAAPGALLAKDGARCQSLNSAARALYRRSV